MTPINPADAQAQVKSYIDAHCHDANPVYSVVIDAAMLRDYLNSATPNSLGQKGSQATQLKLMFAHDISDPTNPTLTFVLIGFDDNGDYILNSNDQLYNQINPCPVVCPLPPGSNASCYYLKLSGTDVCNPV